MNIKEFKANLLLLGWQLDHETPLNGVWKKGVETITWTPAIDSEEPNKRFITHQSVGTRDGYMENRNKAFLSFQECIDFLDEDPK